MENTQKKLDKALKRNLVDQTKITPSPKPSTSNLPPVEETITDTETDNEVSLEE